MLQTKVLAGALGLLLVAAVGMYLWGEQGKPAAEGTVIVKIAHVSPQFTTEFPLFVGKETGIFATRGLTVEPVRISASVGVPTLLSNEVDFIAFGGESVGAILKQEAPIKLVMSFSENAFMYLVGRPGLEPSQIKTLGIGSKYGFPHYLALLAIKEHGLSSASIVTAGSVSAAVGQLEQGEIDASLVNTPGVHKFREKGFKVYGIIKSGMTYPLVTRQDVIDTKPGVVQKMVDAMNEIASYIKQEPEKTKELLFKMFEMEKTEANQKAVDETYALASSYYSETGIPSEEGLTRLIQLAKVSDFETLEEIEAAAATQEEINKVFDFQFVRK